MESFDPEIREYYRYLFLQILRQYHYKRKRDYGVDSSLLNNEVRGIMMSKGWTKKLFDKFEINKKMTMSVASELERDGFIKIINELIFTSYKITLEGLDYIKGFHAPQNPIINVTNNETSIGSGSNISGSKFGNIHSNFNQSTNTQYLFDELLKDVQNFYNAPDKKTIIEEIKFLRHHSNNYSKRKMKKTFLRLKNVLEIISDSSNIAKTALTLLNIFS